MTPEEIGAHFRRHAAMVYRRALILLGNKSDAEDATQEVFMRALRSAEGFAGRSQVSTWLYQITTNYCLNAIRNRGQRAKLFEEHLPDLTEDTPSAIAPSDLLTLRKLLSEADTELATAAVYVYIDGMSHEEAARVLGVSKRTVGNMLERFNSWARARFPELRV
jgi:RNA polymerase sigma-70 factor (ECF subfamily)